MHDTAWSNSCRIINDKYREVPGFRSGQMIGKATPSVWVDEGLEGFNICISR
jgi:hypothetical protein